MSRSSDGVTGSTGTTTWITTWRHPAALTDDEYKVLPDYAEWRDKGLMYQAGAAQLQKAVTWAMGRSTTTANPCPQGHCFCKVNTVGMGYCCRCRKCQKVVE